METLPGGFTLTIGEGCFPLSTDSMVLADFIKLPARAKVLDLGSGCFTLGLLLAAKDQTCCVTGLEITGEGQRAAVQNILDNHLEDRMKSLCRDLRQLPSFLSPGSFQVCISNPPYFSGGPAAHLKGARREDTCSPKDLFQAAAWALKFGGDFFLVHRPERLGELMGEGTSAGFACKRLGLFRHRQDGPVSLVLLQMRKGGKQGLKLEEISLFDSRGDQTDDYQRIYHIKEA